MNFKLMFKGDYIKAVEFNGKVPTMTIASVKIMPLEGDKGVKDKGVISFRETDRGMVLCRTNAESIAAMFGPETDAWVGKRVTLFEDKTVKMGRDVVGGIRVKGSPDITAPISFELRLPKRKPLTLTMVPTGGRAGEFPQTHDEREPGDE